MRRGTVFAVGIFLMVTLCFNGRAQTTVQDWQAKAVEKYPDLGVRGSSLNKRFIDLYTGRKTSNPEFFSNVQWPLLLADELAAQPSPDAPNPQQLIPKTDVPPPATRGEIDAMEEIAGRVTDLMKMAKFTQTTAMVPGKPDADGGYQMIIISTTPLIDPDGATPIKSESVRAWMIMTMGAAAVYTQDSPKPITGIDYGDSVTLKKHEYYVLDMSLARQLQQALKANSIDLDAAYARLCGALVKKTVP